MGLSSKGSSIFVGLVVLAGSCSPRDGGQRAPAQDEVASVQRSPVARRASPRTAMLAALALPHHQFLARLGAHKVVVQSRLSRELEGTAETVVEQTVELYVDAQGHFVARKDTHPQHGSEVIWTGEQLFARLRHGRYQRRRSTHQGEPRQLADRLYGLLPAYVELLRPFISTAREKHVIMGGRRALQAELVLAQGQLSPPRGPSLAPARRWREEILAEHIDGTAVIDQETGVPLEVVFEARWSFAAPKGANAQTGIPEGIDGKRRGTMRVALDQRVSDIGQVPLVKPPPAEQVLDDVRRLRLEIERQMIMGERRLVPWREP